MKKSSLLFVALLLLASCNMTKNLWHKSYQEEINNFITTKNGDQVAFLGQRYHYIIPDNSDLVKRLLFWENSRILYIDSNQTSFEVDIENNVRAKITVTSIFSDLRIEDKLYLESLGFRKQKDGEYSLHLELTGKRYEANDKLYRTFPLNKNYNFTIYYNKIYSPFEVIAKAALSPIIITLDSIIWIGDIISLPML